MTSDRISATTTYVMWREEHLSRVHLSSLVIRCACCLTGHKFIISKSLVGMTRALLPSRRYILLGPNVIIFSFRKK
jgi:hypothetical protein